MSTNFLSPGWRMPTDANQNKLANYSLDLSSSKFIDCGTDLWNKLKTGDAISVSWWHKSDGGSDVFPFNFRPAFSGSSVQMKFAMYWSAGGNSNWVLTGTGIGTQIMAVQPKLPASGWNHYTLSLELGSDTSKQVFYLNGQQVGTTTTAVTSVDQGTNNLYLSQYYSSTYTGTSGTYSSIAFFNYPLSQGQVTTLYGDSTNGPGNPMALSSSPVAYYPLSTSAWNGQYLAENNAIGNYVFDFSSSQEINCGSNASLNQVGSVFTMSCWINTTSGSRGNIMGTYINSGSGYYIDLMGSGTVQGGYHQGAQYYLRSSSSTVNDGNWHHVCYVGSNAADGYLNVYIDGVLNQNALQQSGPPANANSTNPFKINLDGYLGNRYTGKTSNVQVFSLALSATEVETLCNYGSPLQTLASIPQNTNLEGWWKLDASATYNGANWSIPDDSSNSNTGTSLGMTQANLVQSDLQTGASYSSYAMNFSGVSTWINVVDALQNSFPSNSIYTISTWFQYQVDTGCIWGGPIASNFYIYIFNQTKLRIGKRGTTGSTDIIYNFVVGDWINIVMVFDSTANVKIYIDNVFIQDVTIGANTNMTGDFKIAGGLGAYPLECKQSNFSIWEDALTSAQVTEIYNQGLPSDLRSHSAYSSLINWWELGGNSSFNIDSISGATGVGIVLDEMGNINGDSTAGVTLTNGVGTTANGLSVNMTVGNLLGDAPYSTANALSTNMAVTVKVSGVSDATITTGGTGYTTGTNIATTGGTGTNCTINITTVSGGAITALTISSGGINYVIGDVLTISGGNGNATITVSGLNTP